MTPAADEAEPLAQPSLTEEEADDHLAMLVGFFEESESTTREARERSERCRDYYNNIQFTAFELATYRKRRQAPVYENYIQSKVDTLCGIERRTRTDPKAFPRTPTDEAVSEAATDSLRYVADQNRFPGIRSEVFNDILVEGTGCAEVVVEQVQNDFKVIVKRVPWDRFWYDPHARALDFSDAKYLGIVIWDDAKDVKRQYPDRTQYIDTTMELESKTYGDRPAFIWCDTSRKRVRIVQCHYMQDGEWWLATFTRGGFLVDPVVSPYKDKEGRSACTLYARSGYITRENNRYGHVEGLIPRQDEINKRRSKALHLLSERQTYGNKTALQDTKAAKLELAKPDGHIELNGGAKFGDDFGILPTGDMAQGQFLMYQEAVNSMRATGANDALAGKDERAQSGRALQQRAQMGATELEPQTDGLREWTHQIYEAMWMRVRQFWTEQKWVRVTDDERNIKFVGLNKPVTLEEKLKQLPPEQAQQFAQQMQLQPGDPRLQRVVEVENDVSGLDVDIIVDDGPDIATIQGEQFDQLVQLASTPQGAQAIPFTAIIKASSLRNKDAILDEIEKGQQVAQQSQQQAGQLAQQGEQAKTAKTAAEVDKTKAQTRQIEVETHTHGMQAMQNALMPPQPAPVSMQ